MNLGHISKGSLSVIFGFFPYRGLEYRQWIVEFHIFFPRITISGITTGFTSKDMRWVDGAVMALRAKQYQYILKDVFGDQWQRNRKENRLVIRLMEGTLTQEEIRRLRTKFPVDRDIFLQILKTGAFEGQRFLKILPTYREYRCDRLVVEAAVTQSFIAWKEAHSELKRDFRIFTRYIQFAIRRGEVSWEQYYSELWQWIHTTGVVHIEETFLRMADPILLENVLIFYSECQRLIDVRDFMIVNKRHYGFRTWRNDDFVDMVKKFGGWNGIVRMIKRYRKLLHPLDPVLYHILTEEFKKRLAPYRLRYIDRPTVKALQRTGYDNTLTGLVDPNYPRVTPEYERAFREMERQLMGGERNVHAYYLAVVPDEAEQMRSYWQRIGEIIFPLQVEEEDEGEEDPELCTILNKM